MLQVISFTKVKEVYLKIDDYVPLSFRCAETKSSMPLYWRTGDLHKSLIEVGLNKDSGAIFKVTVTLIDTFSLDPASDMKDTMQIIQGIPICDIGNWPPDGYKDELSHFTTLIGDNGVSIWLAPQTPLSTIYEAGNLRFGVDTNNFLCLFEFRAISDHDKDRILRTIIY